MQKQEMLWTEWKSWGNLVVVGKQRAWIQQSILTTLEHSHFLEYWRQNAEQCSEGMVCAWDTNLWGTMKAGILKSPFHCSEALFDKYKAMLPSPLALIIRRGQSVYSFQIRKTWSSNAGWLQWLRGSPLLVSLALISMEWKYETKQRQNSIPLLC